MTAAARISPALVLEQAAVIVFGRDAKKARASWFPADQSDRASKAAELMGMNALNIANDDMRQLATRMPKGRLFDSGKAFVPFVQMAVCDELATHLPAGEKLRLRVVASGDSEKSGGETPPAKIGTSTARHRPKDWSDIQIGSLVLASEGDNEGWWECAVTGIKEGEYSLRWIHYPAEPPFARRREQLALLWASPTLNATK